MQIMPAVLVKAKSNQANLNINIKSNVAELLNTEKRASRNLMGTFCSFSKQLSTVYRDH